LKVLQVLNHFLPYQTAGTEVYTCALSKQLQKRGVEVKIVIPHYGKRESSNYVYDDLFVHQYAEPSIVDRSLIMGLRAPDGLIYFDEIIRHERPDIIHFHEIVGSNGITIKHVQLAKRSSAKVLMTFHLAGYSCKTGTLFHLGKSECNGVIDLQKCSICHLQSIGNGKIASTLTVVSAILHYFSFNTILWKNKLGTALGTISVISKFKQDLHSLFSLCDSVISITDWYQKILIVNGLNENKITVIKQGLPFDNRQKISSENVSFHKPLKLIFLGRINKSKGLHLLLEALDAIQPNLVELSIFGSTDDSYFESYLKEVIAFKKNISWIGKLNQKDVIKTLQQHDILCLCSTLSEMSALVIQEAFAAGIPVLASNVYGNAEQIQHNHNGLLFQFNNVDDLKIQILRCINEPDLITNLSKNIKTPRSFEEVAEEYYTLYKSLLN
jgi:glycosyltransferase involved in cell wall biosynthesis